MLGITDQALALDLDVAAAGRVLLHESGADHQQTVIFGQPERRPGIKRRLDQI
jgi:hypothetical protein